MLRLYYCLHSQEGKFPLGFLTFRDRILLFPECLPSSGLDDAEKPDKTHSGGRLHCHRKVPSRASEFKWGRISGKDLPGHPLRWPLVSVNKKAALDTKPHNNSLGQYK